MERANEVGLIYRQQGRCSVLRELIAGLTRSVSKKADPPQERTYAAIDDRLASIERRQRQRAGGTD